MAIPPNAVLGDEIIFDEDTNTDLQRLFGTSNARIISELQHRFDRLTNPQNSLLPVFLSRCATERH